MKETQCYAMKGVMLDLKTAARGFAHFFAEKEQVALCGKRPVVRVNVREMKEGEESIYWAYWSNTYESFDFVFPSEEAVRMMSPDGFRVIEHQNVGIVMQVVIEEVQVHMTIQA